MAAPGAPSVNSEQISKNRSVLTNRAKLVQDYRPAQTA